MIRNSERDCDWATRAAISTLLEILAILSRGDVRSEVLSELDHQIAALKRFQSHSGVDGGRLETLMRNLSVSRDEISSIGTSYLQPLKESDFLNTIKHRSAIPGGTCEFDLPEYSHWLRQPIARRQQDMTEWIQSVSPLCDGASGILWLIRESARPSRKQAVNGMYQHSVQKDDNCRLLRVSLAKGSSLFPEISGSQHRFTVRFLEWSTVERRAIQTGHDVPFQLSIC
jgi:cell division protein ZapD